MLFNRLNEVYQKLIAFCTDKDFKVKDSSEKYYLIKAKKSSLFFWKVLRLELELLVEKDKVQVEIKICKMGLRQHKLESEYIAAIENLF